MVRAPPRVLPRSVAPSRVLREGRSGPGSSLPGLACTPCGGCVPRGWWGAVPGGGWPATVARGVWCQALSLPRPPVLRGGQPGYRNPCVPGAVGAGVGTQHQFHGVRPCGPALLALGVAGGRPRGGAFHRFEGRLRSGAPPPPTAHPLGGLLRSVTHMLWARLCACGGPSLPLCPACPVKAACRGAGRGPSPGGWPAIVARGVCCQALSLPLPPVLCGGRPGSRDPCVPGAVGAGVGTQPRPHSVRPCGPALLAVGVAEGRHRGGCLPPLRGASEVRRSPSSDCPSTRRAVGVRHPRAVGEGVWVWGPNTVPLACTPCISCVPWGWWGAVPGGGVACHCCEGRLVSGAVPPPAARPLGRVAGVPRSVCPGCGRCRRGDPAPAPQRAPLRTGVARCGGGGRASPGGCLPPL